MIVNLTNTKSNRFLQIKIITLTLLMLQILANMKYYKQITFNHLKKINKNNQINNERGTNK